MPWYFGGMAPTAARRAKPVQRSSSQGLQGNPDACHPRRGVVGPSYGSFASGQARKLIPSAGPPLPTTTTPLGRRGGPIGRVPGGTPADGRPQVAPTDGAPSRRAPRRRHKLRIARFAASGKARSLHCASSPHDDHFVGSPRGPHWEDTLGGAVSDTWLGKAKQRVFCILQNTRCFAFYFISRPLRYRLARSKAWEAATWRTRSRPMPCWIFRTQVPSGAARAR